METILGEGVLTWPRWERITDRYGSIGLIRTWGAFSSLKAEDIVTFSNIPEGRLGQLLAEVLATRQSPGIGDLSRGFDPQTPNIGERILLGEGILFVEHVHDDHLNVERTHLGVKPVDDREVDWLFPQALYRVHAQTVKLLFTE